MGEGMTCYERDEVFCEDQMCLRVGCRVRNERLSAESKMPAKIWAGEQRDFYRHWHRSKPREFDDSVCHTSYIRADLVEPLVEALREIASTTKGYPNASREGEIARAALQAYEAAQ